eukprot:2175185-Pleurochrysis_carterae.AAC.3
MVFDTGHGSAAQHQCGRSQKPVQGARPKMASRPPSGQRALLSEGPCKASAHARETCRIGIEILSTSRTNSHMLACTNAGMPAAESFDCP